MKPYLLSLGAGLIVGVIYGLMNVRSPAPPIIALVGLFGILLGEQIVPLSKRVFQGSQPGLGQVASQCRSHLFGRLPGHHDDAAAPARPTETT